jgi:L-amino acid N-acyltransferase YncA
MAPEYKVRLATIGDMESVFELSNDDFVRHHSLNQEKIDWATHQKWFQDKIANKDCEFFIVESPEGKMIGQARVDRKIVSISLAAPFRGKGLGSEILRAINGLSNVQTKTAYVRKDNIASLKTFCNAGYRVVGEKIMNDQACHELVYEK